MPELTPARLEAIRARWTAANTPYPVRRETKTLVAPRDISRSVLADVGVLLAEIDRQREVGGRFQLAAAHRILNLELEVTRQAEDNERLRSALEGKVWEPTLEAALRKAIGRCKNFTEYGRATTNCYYTPVASKCPECRDALALLDRLSPQEPA